MLTLLNRFKILASSLCVVFAGAFSAQAQEAPDSEEERLARSAGPVFRLPAATDDLLGAEKWGVGPTAVALRQAKGWTYGGLVSQVWSVAGEGDRADI